MNPKQPYSDSSILLSGKYRFVRLDKIPAEYLLNIYFKGNKKNKYPDRELIEYIKNNLQKLQKRQETGEIEATPEILCEKICFPSKGDARRELKRIRERTQEHKKPIRVYECEKCSGWHLTSLPYEEWKKRKNKL